MLRMNLVNKTPHNITLRTATGDQVIPPTYPPARVSARNPVDIHVEGVPVPIRVFPDSGVAENLPPPEDGFLYIVSIVVASHPDVRTRADVVSPGTGPNDGAIRDERGQVLAVTRLNGSSEARR
jgi:hypothetical protein